MDQTMGAMMMPGVGFMGLLLIGVLAGYFAEKAMNRRHGLLTNLLVGIAGSFVGGTLASVLDINFYGFVGNLVVATAGALLILWFFGKREQGPRS
ncbi:MAG: GlsB/YeaQ/YmgE family stress response membrane protein [Rhizobiaceae bacterium]